MDVNGQPKNFGQQYMLDRRVHTFESECTAYKLDIAFLNIEFSYTIKTVQDCDIRFILLQREVASRKNAPDFCWNDIKAVLGLYGYPTSEWR